jgi:cytochrome c
MNVMLTDVAKTATGQWLVVTATTFLIGLLWTAPPVRADATKGADAFTSECSDCHSVKEGKNKKGPSLFGAVGRKAGTLAGFDNYSDAMKASDFTWSREKLADYITHPKSVVPKGKMKFDGLDDAQERADLLDYLAEQH